MVPLHDYVKRYAEAFAITKIRTFKHEPFFIVGGGGGGGLIRGTLRYMLSGPFAVLGLKVIYSTKQLFPSPHGCVQ